MSVDVLLTRIDRVRASEQRVAVSAGLLRTLLAFVGLVAGFFVLDWLALQRLVEGVEANRVARGVLVAGMIATIVYAFIRNVWAELVRELDDDEIALRVERRHPELNGRLISTIQLSREAGENEYVGSPDLIRALEVDTVSFAQAIDFSDVINVETLKKVGLAAVGFTLLAVAAGAYRVDYAKAVLGRMLLADTAYPTRTRILFVTPGGVVARGEPHEVVAELDPDGYLPDAALLLVSHSSGRSFEYEMVRAREEEDVGPHGGVVYRGAIQRVLEELEYKVVAYDARSPGWERLTVFHRPAIKSLELTYGYPEYTRKPGRKTSVGDIRAIEGTQVGIVAALNKPVRSARLGVRLGLESFEPVAMELDEAGLTATASITVSRDGYYKILLLDAEGLENRDPIEHVIDAIPDREPSVRILFPGRDKTVTRFAMWPIRFEARDDFGITKGWLKYRVTSDLDGGLEPIADEARQGPALGFELGGLVRGAARRELKAEVSFDLQRLGLRTGSRLTYWIELADNSGVNVGRSREYEFSIAETDEVLYMIGTIQEEALGRIETIIEKQKESREGVDDVRRDVRRESRE